MFTSPCARAIPDRVSLRTFTSGLILLLVGFLLVASVKDSKAQSNNDKLVLAWTDPADSSIYGVSSIAWGDWDDDGDLDLAAGARVYENDMGTLKLDPANGFGWDGGGGGASVAWGDWDNDGDLDLAANTRVYENDGGTLKLDPANGFGWDGGGGGASVAWGDWDNDNDLDLAVDMRVYENDGGTLKLDPANGFGWDGGSDGASVAWGDWDNDGDLDLAVDARVYENDGGTLKLDPANGFGWDGASDGISVAWGDWDNDGDLDLAVSSYFYTFRVYENDEATLKFDPANGFGWDGAGSASDVSAIAWGDWDNDGDLDLAIAQGGNDYDPYFNEIFENTGSDLVLAWLSPIRGNTATVAWGDWDGDGDLDLAFGGDEQIAMQPTRVYENLNSALPLIWSLPRANEGGSVAWGDWDGDGDLDLAVGCPGNINENQVYENIGKNLSLIWSAPSNCTFSPSEHNLAWGDWDNDGDLDLAAGQEGGSLRIYENADKTLKLDPANGFGWEGGGSSSSVAWGDWDNDGDLDLATGDHTEPARVYENDQGTLTWMPANGLGWEGSGCCSNVAWGDWDGDGDLDLAADRRVYENDDGTLKLDPANGFGWDAGVAGEVLAWGDWDKDGDLDLASGRSNERNRVFENRNGTMILVWSAPESTFTYDLAWGDWDGDDDLDLAVGNGDPDNDRMQAIQIYKNNRGNFELGWSSPTSYENHWSLAFGDWDNDGRLELAVAASDYGNPLQIFADRNATASNHLNIRMRHPGCDAAPFFSCGKIIDSPIVPINYTVYGDNPIRLIKAYYSLDNGSHWRPAAATNATITTNLAASPTGNQYTYDWDIYNSNIFGESDSVLFRLDVYPGFKQPGPYQYTSYSVQTLPFRLRGSQARVVNRLAQPVPGAIVQRLPTQQTTTYSPYRDQSGKPYLTNPLGYLQGYDEIHIGDQLLAMQPITGNSVYTIYQTSAMPTASGLAAQPVTAGGVQTLTISPDNTLILFNLIVSLEWDARNDATFMAQLENDLQRTSQILYDLTNGQAALGDIQIYQDKGFWGEANLVIQANNSQRPSAIMGGIVLTGTADVDVNGQTLPDAYVPGQVRIGPSWNRFGNPDGTLGEDWPRALAHELGHYFFFQADDYIGVTSNGQLTATDCVGSTMADPYEDSDSEFLTRSQWAGDCLNTVANRYLGRADWESIIRFYSMLNGTTINPGPSQLPLAVTKIETFAPITPTTALAAPFFHLVDNTNNTVSTPDGRGQAYLIKTRGSSDPTDDYVIAEGSPVGDLVQPRGAAPGDRLCVFDYSHSPLRLGCHAVGSTPGAVMLQDTPNWTPQIQVAAVTSNTLIITVTNVTDSHLNVQLLPALGAASAESPMIRINDHFVQTVTAVDGAFYGYIRIWVPGSQPLKELISEYTAVEAWHGRSYAWGGRSYAWGGRSYAWGGRSYAWGGRSYAWGAPVMSGDGQVSIFPLDNPFGSSADYTLQTVAFPPHLPAWLTPVGQAYQVSDHTSFGNSAILFRYLARDVPAGYEDGLHIYYLADSGTIWQRLPTQLDTRSNQASTALQGNGIYLLVATVEVRPAFTAGWNSFGYPVQATRPVADALAAIAGSYNTVYTYDLSAQRWLMFAPTVPAPFNDLVNTLHTLEYAHSYWIYATQPVTLYLGVGNPSSEIASSNVNDALAGNAPLAAATYYGWITPSTGFTPMVGMRVTANIDGVICGETTIQHLDDKLAYVLQVAASDPATPSSNCGARSKEIVFGIDNWIMDHNRTWDNSQAWLQSLNLVRQATTTPTTTPTTTTTKAVYLPYIKR